MQGKGLIKLFLVLVTLVCLVQVLYFIPTNRVENDADSYAQETVGNLEGQDARTQYKVAYASYIDSMTSEEVLRIPMLQSYTYSDLKKQQMAFGLDLKGGMSAILQVDLRELLVALAGTNAKDVHFVEALDKAQEAMRSSQSDYVTLFADAYRNTAATKSLARIFQRSEALGEINAETTDGQVVRMLREKANETVSLTYNMLKERIDRLGVTQPNVSLDAGRDMILVEMPGIDNKKRAREFLQASAQLEFWNTYRITDPGIYAAFVEADKRLTNETGADSSAVKEPELEAIITPVYDEDGNITSSDTTYAPVQQTSFTADGRLFSLLSMNNPNAQLYYQTVMGIADKNKMKAIDTLLAEDNIRSLFPANSKFVWSYKPFEGTDGEISDRYELYLIKKNPGSDKAPLEGDVVTDASPTQDPNTGLPEVSLRMDANGSKKWAELTTKAANDGNREVAIVLDNRVVSAPRVNGPITGGSSSISGGFTTAEAVDLSNILEVGKLPAKTTIIQEQTVGPSLGAKNISSSIQSLTVGFIIVLLFMILYYGGAGIVSIIALLANIFFIFGALSSFGTVLTLPGIAGIVLTIGMAVDANVIIFERVREELRAGKSKLASIADGFKNSYSAIIDANVTTLLTAFVLAYFGLGPIKGFAVVLIIGVISSLFTAVLFGKLMIDSWASKGRNVSFWTGWSKNVLANVNIDWMGKRKIAYVISGILLVAGLTSIFTKGFDLGVDFKGGYSYTIEFLDSDKVDIDNLRETLASEFGEAPVVKRVDVDNTYNVITSYLMDDTSEDASENVVAKLHEGVNKVVQTPVALAKFTDSDAVGAAHITASSKVLPTIADDIKTSSFYAGIFALLLIFLYIFIRFNKWQYSLGAVVALFHDAIIVLGLFSLLKDYVPFELTIDQAFIAAILTVIGYSINDTVVVFDRIREYIGIYTNKEKDEVLNMAISSTFSRTIITSLTTLFVVAILFVFGGGSIKGFAFALLLGIIVGTYSSIFVATPIVRDLSDKLVSKVQAAKKSFSRAKS